MTHHTVKARMFGWGGKPHEDVYVPAIFNHNDISRRGTELPQLMPVLEGWTFRGVLGQDVEWHGYED